MLPCLNKESLNYDLEGVDKIIISSIFVIAGEDDEYSALKAAADLQCSECSADTFPSMPALRKHVHEEHGLELEKHVCSRCGACFVLKNQLEKHLALHSALTQVNILISVTQVKLLIIHR